MAVTCYCHDNENKHRYQLRGSKPHRCRDCLRLTQWACPDIPPDKLPRKPQTPATFSDTSRTTTSTRSTWKIFLHFFLTWYLSFDVNLPVKSFPTLPAYLHSNSAPTCSTKVGYGTPGAPPTLTRMRSSVRAGSRHATPLPHSLLISPCMPHGRDTMLEM